MKLLKNKLSLLSIIVIVISCLIIDQEFRLWRRPDRVIEWDVRSYYGYLPAVFIFNDIALNHQAEYKKDINGTTFYYFWSGTAPNGKHYFKATLGLSILYAPFFFTGHLMALTFGHDSNGFSKPYKKMLLISAIFYLFVGLFYLRKILKRYFSEAVTATSLLLLGVGTNLLCYSTQSGPMPHVYLFALYALFMYYTIRWYEKNSFKYTLLTGFLLGLISLIRPPDALIIVFFLFWGVTNIQSLRERILLLLNNYKLLVLMAFCAFLVWAPQFIYWKNITGQFIFDTYGTHERFFFNDPKFIDGLFSFRKGWLIYTPLMAFALLGLFLLKNDLKKFRLSLYVFIPINLYLVFSWWCWWYGGSYGQRSLIESYALLSIPLTCFIKYIFSQKVLIKIAFGIICLFFIWLNIFQTFQFELHSLHYDGMSRELYFKQFGKFGFIENFDNYIDAPDYKNAAKGIR